MATLSIARRYARALLDVTSETQTADVALAQLSALTTAFEQNPDFQELLTHPAYTREQRHAVLEQLLPRLGVTDPAVVNLSRLLVDRSRFVHLPNLLRVYRDFVDAREGRIRGRVTSAQPLPEDVLLRLQQNLKRMTQRDVLLDTKVDPSLIGGVSTQLGSLVLDGSLRSQLEEMRQLLSQA